MGKLFHFMGQDPLISFKAGKYAMRRTPGLFANAIVLPPMKFLLPQNLVLSMVFSICVGLLSVCAKCLFMWVSTGSLLSPSPLGWVKKTIYVSESV